MFYKDSGKDRFTQPDSISRKCSRVASHAVIANAEFWGR